MQPKEFTITKVKNATLIDADSSPVLVPKPDYDVNVKAEVDAPKIELEQPAMFDVPIKKREYYE